MLNRGGSMFRIGRIAFVVVLIMGGLSSNLVYGWESCGTSSDCDGKGICSQGRCGHCNGNSDCKIGDCDTSKSGGECGYCGSDSDCDGGSCSNHRCSNAEQ
jgi:hypothetical protein